MPSFVGFRRFEYRINPDADLGPPHCVWDNQTGDWAPIGSWSTVQQAEACAYGMNQARVLCETLPARALDLALRDLRRVVKELEGLTDA